SVERCVAEEPHGVRLAQVGPPVQAGARQGPARQANGGGADIYHSGVPALKLDESQRRPDARAASKVEEAAGGAGLREGGEKVAQEELVEKQVVFPGEGYRVIAPMVVSHELRIVVSLSEHFVIRGKPVATRALIVRLAAIRI